MNIGVAVFGTRGDVGPMEMLAMELRTRGHHVQLFLNPSMTPATSLDTWEVGAPWSLEEVLAHPRALDPRFVWSKVYMPQVAPFFAQIARAHAERPLDAIISHVWTMGAQFAAMRLGIPQACVSLQPMVWMSRRRPPRLSALELPAWALGPAFRCVAPVLERGVLGPPVRREARALGLQIPRAASPFGWSWRQMRCHLGLWDPMFRGAQEDDPPRSHIVGFVQGDEEGSLEPELEAFCREHRPWVLGLGSALPLRHQSLYAEVAASTTAPLVLVGARGMKAPRPNVWVTERAPYLPLFQRARGVLHHGGVGTTAEALRAGVPQSVLAFGNDMFDNGVCVERMGVGVVQVAARANARSIASSLERLSGEAVRRRAKGVARAMRTPAEARARAVELLESCLTP